MPQHIDYIETTLNFINNYFSQLCYVTREGGGGWYIDCYDVYVLHEGGGGGGGQCFGITLLLNGPYNTSSIMVLL